MLFFNRGLLAESIFLNHIRGHNCFKIEKSIDVKSYIIIMLGNCFKIKSYFRINISRRVNIKFSLMSITKVCLKLADW